MEDGTTKRRERHVTRGGFVIDREIESIDGVAAIAEIALALDERRGALLTSGFEFPGRYTRWDLGFVDPPLVLEARGRSFTVRALTGRGLVLLPGIVAALSAHPDVASLVLLSDRALGRVRVSDELLAEEDRTRRASVLSVVRAIGELFASPDDERLGLYGAFGYDLVFQIESLRMRLPREATDRELVLYLPDRLVVVDHAKGTAERISYDFTAGAATTARLPREPVLAESAPPREGPPVEPDAHRFVAGVEKAKEAFAAGDLFEVVLSHTFRVPTAEAPSEVFTRLRRRNPAPYGFFVSLGEGEHLVGASPEMFVRVEGDRVETCPIAGTIPRGEDAIDDAEQIRRLLVSAKDEAELTMCTDVDRNDKSRVSVPGSVRVIGRRQVEMYSRLIHTVDHVEGRLRDGCDAIDAFLAHAWAVTITGAPKLDAMQFVEDHEDEPRRYYGGAVGYVGFDGSLNTGLTLRTIHFRGGVAEVRAGATLLAASDPREEERETRTKASALLDALLRPDREGVRAVEPRARPGEGRRILLVDHRDSFVHTLANYLRQTGAEVVTYRAGFPEELLDRVDPDLAVLSPGPGTPRDFALSRTLSLLLARRIPIFGVCLGLQGIVEHFGGSLGRLEVPAHGHASTVNVRGGAIFDGLPRSFRVGRYHSLFAERATLPSCLSITAESEDGVVMAVEHRELAVHAVQFHPESILTPEAVGLRLVANALRNDSLRDARCATLDSCTS